MKHIITIFFFLFSCALHAEIFCPELIQCQESNHLNSCSGIHSSEPYWNKLTGKNNLRGIYYNTYVSAPFYSHDQGYALCVYTHEKSYSTLTLHAHPEAHLEMLYDPNSSWNKEESWWSCQPKYHEACPLQVQNALMIKNNTNEMLTLSNGMKIFPGHFVRLYPNDFEQGWADIYTATNYIGRAEVDLNNQLQLLNIIETGAASFRIIQTENFNAVTVMQKHFRGNVLYPMSQNQ